MDETIKCVECGTDFVFTTRDQEFYKEKGFSKPKRCKMCRELRKQGIIGKETTHYGKKKTY